MRCSTVQANKVLVVQPTVLVPDADPPKLAWRGLLGSYNWGLNDFNFVVPREQQFHTLFSVSLAIWDHFLTKLLNFGGSRIKTVGLYLKNFFSLNRWTILFNIFNL